MPRRTNNAKSAAATDDLLSGLSPGLLDRIKIPGLLIARARIAELLSEFDRRIAELNGVDKVQTVKKGRGRPKKNAVAASVVAPLKPVPVVKKHVTKQPSLPLKDMLLQQAKQHHGVLDIDMFRAANIGLPSHVKGQGVGVVIARMRSQGLLKQRGNTHVYTLTPAGKEATTR